MDYARVIKLPQYFRNLQRLSEITRVLLKHGFGDLVERLNLFPYLESGLRLLKPSILLERPSPVDFASRLRTVFEELGPTFIKFAQLISTRPDIFSANITREFRKLQDKVSPFPSDLATRVVSTELGRPIEELFRSFEDKPLAAASIAQVHLATLKDGSRVVVKVQRPDLLRILEADLDILRGFAALIEEHIPESHSFSPVELVEEFARSIRLECDFRREASSIERFASAFSDEKDLVVPRVYRHLSSQRVLTEEFIEGVPADDLEAVERSRLNGRALAAVLNRVLLRSVFEHRFFHADPHPGNVLLTPDSRVALVDFGQMGRLDRTRVSYILKFLVALFSSDLDRVIDVLKEAEVAPEFLDEVALKNQIAELLDTYLGRALGELDVSRLLTEVFEVAKRYGIRPPPDLLLVGKSLTTLQHIAAGLDPEFNPLLQIKPYLLQRYVSHITDPRLHAAQMADAARAYQRMLADLPVQVRSLLESLVRQRFTVYTADRDSAERQLHQSRLVNRAIMALVGIVFLALGVALRGPLGSGLDATLSYVFLVLGTGILLTVWLAIRRSGGTSR